MPTEHDELLTPTEVQQRLKVSRHTLWRYGSKGVLTQVRLTDKTVRYLRSEVEALASPKKAS